VHILWNAEEYDHIPDIDGAKLDLPPGWDGLLVNVEEVSCENSEHCEDEQVDCKESWDVLGVEHSAEDQRHRVYGHLRLFLVHKEALEEPEGEARRLREAEDFRKRADERGKEVGSG
jgi:hypothetical protein